MIDTEQDLQPGAEIGVRYPTYLIQVRASEVAQPARGDRVQIPSAIYTIDGFDPVNEWEWQLPDSFFQDFSGFRQGNWFRAFYGGSRFY